MTSTITNDLLSLKDQFLAVEENFKVGMKYLDEKCKHFREIDNMLASVVTNKDFMIRLDIGGKVFLMKLSTLIGKKDTIFFNLLASYVSKGQEVPKEFFFDRNPTFFPLVIEYLKYNTVSLKNYKKFEREDIKDEFEFYGMDCFSKNKRAEIDIEWDKYLSKQEACTVDPSDSKLLNVHSTTCYTHFLTNREFSNENFVIEFESTVNQTENYYYFGIINSSYSTSSCCGCSNPSNAFYIQRDGSVHLNGVTQSSNLTWNSDKCVIGMRVMLSEMEMYFYKDDPLTEIGPYAITSGTKFRPYAAHCNNANGNITIINCYYV